MLITVRQIIAGNQRFNIDRDSSTGEVLRNVDSSENYKRGYDANYGVKGTFEEYGGMVGSALGFTAMGVGIADKISRTMGNKDGIVKPMVDKTFKSWKKSGSSEDSVPNKSSNPRDESDNSQSTDSSKSQQNDSVQHDTPPNSNDTDSVSKNTERSKSGKGKAGAVMRLLSLGGLFAATDSEASANAMRNAQRQFEQDNSNFDQALSQASSDTGAVALAADVGMLATKNGAMLGATASKAMARFVPGIGTVAGAVDAADRTNNGDYLGAGMSVVAGAVANVPVAGTALSMAVVGAQMVTDHFGITGGTNPNVPEHAQRAMSGDGGSTTRTVDVIENVKRNVEDVNTGGGSGSSNNSYGGGNGTSSTNVTEMAFDSSGRNANSDSGYGGPIPAHTNTMGGGYVGASIADSNQAQHASGQKIGKVMTELASNQYIQNSDLLEQIMQNNAMADNNMKGGSD